MFQYAAARSMSLRYGVPLLLDLSWFSNSPDRRFALSSFCIVADTLPHAAPSGTTIHDLWHSALRSARHRLAVRGLGRSQYVEKEFSFNPELLKRPPPIRLDGYFQSERYFEEIASTIARDFQLVSAPSSQTLAMRARIEASDAICLHVRRGDYVTNGIANAYHGLCSISYYRRALSVAVGKLSNPHCFVFSDDVSWVRENLHVDLPTTYVDINGPDQAHEDLYLMAGCRNYVIANSSLSWWGAWLGSREGKLVIAPRKWFNDRSIDTHDLIPDGWIQA